MGKHISLSVAILCLVIFASPVQAELIDRGTGMIYDTDLGITWLQDTSMSGKMSWNNAMSWADTLGYGGYEDWRLPFFPSIGGLPYPPYQNLGEMSYLYYTVLGNSAGGPLVNTGPFVMPSDIQTFWLGTANPDTPATGAWSQRFDTGLLNSVSQGESLYAWAVRNGDTGPSVSVGKDYITNLLLGDTFSFDYWWQMGQEPAGLNFDIMYFRDNSWQLLGGDINFDGSSSAWATRSFAVPENLRGLNTQIRFMVYDLGAETDPTVYLRNVASNGTAPVPEPATLLLLGTGLIGLAGFRKKLKR